MRASLGVIFFSFPSSQPVCILDYAQLDRLARKLLHVQRDRLDSHTATCSLDLPCFNLVYALFRRRPGRVMTLFYNDEVGGKLFYYGKASKATE